MSEKNLLKNCCSEMINFAIIDEKDDEYLHNNNFRKPMELDGQTNHEKLVKWASETFINCHLKINEDFIIYKDIENQIFGYFKCKLCPGYSCRGITCKFKFNKCGSMDFSKMKVHLKKHFTSNLKILKFDLDKVNSKESELQSIVMANENHIEMVVRKAAYTFRACDLKVNDDFCLYRNMKNKDLGYFQCKLCSKESKMRDYLKVTFTKNDSLVFTNIERHLSNHFTKFEKTTTDTRTKRKFPFEAIEERTLEEITFEEMKDIVLNRPDEEIIRKSPCPRMKNRKISNVKISFDEIISMVMNKTNDEIKRNYKFPNITRKQSEKIETIFDEMVELANEDSKCVDTERSVF